MFRKIIGTLGTRLVTALVTFLITALNTRYLGAENVGTIYLITLSVTIIQLFNNFMGGSSLVYMTPRTGFTKLFIAGNAWTFFITLLSVLAMKLAGSFSAGLEFIPRGYTLEVIVLAMVMSFTSVNYMLILGKEKVSSFNLLNLLQVLILIICLLMAVFVFHVRTVMAYYWAILISYGFSWMLSFLPIASFLRDFTIQGMKPLLVSLLRYGTFVQFANIFQLMNYRVSFYMVDFWFGRTALGVMGPGFSIAEGLWIISRSLAMVQYTRISNVMDFDYSVRLTLILAKIAIALTTIAVCILVAVPEWVFCRVFGNEFGMIRTVVACLGPGIIALSFSMILSHFFSGIDKPYHNTVSSGLGLVFTLAAGFLLVPRFGIIGASLAASVSYTVSTIYQLIVFLRMTDLRMRDFIPNRRELGLLADALRNLGRRSNVSELS